MADTNSNAAANSVPVDPEKGPTLTILAYQFAISCAVAVGGVVVYFLEPVAKELIPFLPDSVEFTVGPLLLSGIAAAAAALAKFLKKYHVEEKQAALEETPPIPSMKRHYYRP